MPTAYASKSPAIINPRQKILLSQVLYIHAEYMTKKTKKYLNKHGIIQWYSYLICVI